MTQEAIQPTPTWSGTLTPMVLDDLLATRAPSVSSSQCPDGEWSAQNLDPKWSALCSHCLGGRSSLIDDWSAGIVIPVIPYGTQTPYPTFTPVPSLTPTSQLTSTPVCDSAIKSQTFYVDDPEFNGVNVVTHNGVRMTLPGDGVPLVLTLPETWHVTRVEAGLRTSSATAGGYRIDVGNFTSTITDVISRGQGVWVVTPNTDANEIVWTPTAYNDVGFNVTLRSYVTVQYKELCQSYTPTPTPPPTLTPLPTATRQFGEDWLFAPDVNCSVPKYVSHEKPVNAEMGYTGGLSCHGILHYFPSFNIGFGLMNGLFGLELEDFVFPEIPSVSLCLEYFVVRVSILGDEIDLTAIAGVFALFELLVWMRRS